MLDSRLYVDDQRNLVHVNCDSDNCFCRTHDREETLRPATQEEKTAYEAGEGFHWPQD